MAQLQLQNISKSFGSVRAVDGVSLDIPSGQFFSLLGPSGCGKTTLLRIIAGLEQPDKGRVCMGERDVTATPPERRHIGMVFQNYALFPNMTVAGNVAFGLKAQKKSSEQIKKSVADALAMVELTDKIDRPAPALSGGEQQRVALARAVATEPDVLLFDEPLSNLDARLRVETRLAIRQLVSRLGVTVVYVTHDQEEALSLSDELAIMRDGKVLQQGTPQNVYDTPSSPFVASFLGRANIIPVECEAFDLITPSGVRIPGDDRNDTRFVLVRPEDLREVPSGQAWVSGTVTAREFLGAHVRLRIVPAQGPEWEALLPAADASSEPGDTLHLAGRPDCLVCYTEDDR